MKKKDDKMFVGGVTSIPAKFCVLSASTTVQVQQSPPFVFTFLLLVTFFFSASARGQGWFVIDDRERLFGLWCTAGILQVKRFVSGGTSGLSWLLVVPPLQAEAKYLNETKNQKIKNSKQNMIK